VQQSAVVQVAVCGSVRVSVWLSGSVSVCGSSAAVGGSVEVCGSMSGSV
jgi:hypothetical protein